MNSDRATGIRITAARYGIPEAGTVSPSVGVNGQARPVALTPCVPLSRKRARGNAQLPSPTLLGEGLGVRAKERVHSARSELKRCTLISWG